MAAPRVYVGNLPLDIKERELDDLFYKYGRILDIDLKTPSRPPAFAFITFDHHRDAEDAIYGRDNYNFDGYRLRVEFAKGDRRDRGDRDRRDRFDAPRKTGAKRSEFGVEVSNLPRGCSWQDLKDFMRKAGDVIYTDVDKNGGGKVEFGNREDMEYALKSLHDTEFRNHNDTSVIRIYPVNGGGGSSSSSGGGGKYGGGGDAGRGRSLSRSPSPDRNRGGRDRSRSRSRDRARSPRSRSRSPSGDRSSPAPAQRSPAAARDESPERSPIN